MTFSILVKGNVGVIEVARRIGACGSEAKVRRDRGTSAGETLFKVSSSMANLELALQRWFLEPPSEPPFPLGTLLYYNKVRA